MTCGSCQAAAEGLAYRRSCLAMCHVCRQRPSCPAYQVCTLNGAFLPVGDCPRRRWPDKSGHVRWLRIRWMGVPAPVRWRIGLESAWAAWKERTGPGYFPGCGCVYRLKTLWTGLRSYVSRATMKRRSLPPSTPPSEAP